MMAAPQRASPNTASNPAYFAQHSPAEPILQPCLVGTLTAARRKASFSLHLPLDLSFLDNLGDDIDYSAVRMVTSPAPDPHDAASTPQITSTAPSASPRAAANIKNSALLRAKEAAVVGLYFGNDCGASCGSATAATTATATPPPASTAFPPSASPSAYSASACSSTSATATATATTSTASTRQTPAAAARWPASAVARLPSLRHLFETSIGRSNGDGGQTFIGEPEPQASTAADDTAATSTATTSAFIPVFSTAATSAFATSASSWAPHETFHTTVSIAARVAASTPGKKRTRSSGTTALMAASVPEPPRHHSGDAAAVEAPVLMIAEQPAQHGRFRYEAEGRHRSLGGRTDGRHPTVVIHPSHRKHIPDGALLHVSLVTRHDGPNGTLLPHWHTLEHKNGEDTSTTVVGGQAIFTNLIIKRQKTKEKHPPEDQRVVRLHFHITYTGPEGKAMMASVTSQPVFNSELRIDRISHPVCPANSSVEMFVLSTKIQRKAVAFQITDPDAWPQNYNAELAPGWHLDEHRRPTAFIANSSLQTHHQLACVVPIPQFWAPNIQASRTVEFRLLDTADGTESMPVAFQYVPPAYSTTRVQAAQNEYKVPSGGSNRDPHSSYGASKVSVAASRISAQQQQQQQQQSSPSPSSALSAAASFSAAASAHAAVQVASVQGGFRKPPFGGSASPALGSTWWLHKQSVATVGGASASSTPSSSRAHSPAPGMVVDNAAVSRPCVGPGSGSHVVGDGTGDAAMEAVDGTSVLDKAMPWPNARRSSQATVLSLLHELLGPANRKV